MNVRRQGVVKWFKEEKGYGRIMLDGEDGNHVYVHYSGIKPDPERFPNGNRILKAGQRVSFDLIENPASKDQAKKAINVVILSD
jgi:cold shock protein